MLPQDPIILLSYVNTKLRDEFHSLDAFCDGMQADQIIKKLAGNTCGFKSTSCADQFAKALSEN